MGNFCRQNGDPSLYMLSGNLLLSVPVSYFNIPGTLHENKWSVATFGEEWDSERCNGTVLKVLSGGQFARVRWDIDGGSQCVGLANLQLEAEEGGLDLQQREGEFFSLGATHQAPVMLLMKLKIQ